MFFDFEGNEISVADFIDLYEPCYFLGNEKARGIVHTQSSRYVEENEIMPILLGHITSYKDLAKILAWKIGRIKQQESEDVKAIKYATDWELCETQNPLRYGIEMQLQKLADYILANRDELEQLADTDPQECLRRIRNVNVPGIGTVYLITILFFLSHGQYPIYDRFAMAALLAYERDCKINDAANIKVEDLPTKWTRGFAEICNNQYANYIKKLDCLKVDYRNDRKLDRALWVYGHAFI